MADWTDEEYEARLTLGKFDVPKAEVHPHPTPVFPVKNDVDWRA